MNVMVELILFSKQVLGFHMVKCFFSNGRRNNSVTKARNALCPKKHPSLDLHPTPFIKHMKDKWREFCMTYQFAVFWALNDSAGVGLLVGPGSSEGIFVRQHTLLTFSPAFCSI